MSEAEATESEVSGAMSIRLNCLACGHAMDLGDAYEDYAGEVRCWACRTVLDVALQEGRLKAMKRSGSAAAPSSGEQAPSPETVQPAAAASAAGHDTG